MGFFLFLARVTILFSKAESFGHFSKWPNEEHFCEIGFVFWRAVQMLSKDFSTFSSKGHFV